MSLFEDISAYAKESPFDKDILHHQCRCFIGKTIEFLESLLNDLKQEESSRLSQYRKASFITRWYHRRKYEKIRHERMRTEKDLSNLKIEYNSNI